MFLFALSCTGALISAASALHFSHQFARQRQTIQWRVHVNGIRGKSTVTRYISAIFRAAGYQTHGKTTGTAARIVLPNGMDYDFGRKGYANINEQVKILKQFIQQGAEAVVMECMAVNPVYAEWLEQKVMQAHIGVITNVRLDHTDYMGETLPEIAESLSVTTPTNGLFITSETNPELLAILANKAAEKGSQMLTAHSHMVQPEDMQGFDHFAIEENVAIALQVANFLKVPRSIALEAIQTAPPDPGAFSMQRVNHKTKPHKQTQIDWANLFAVNDRESFIFICQRLFDQYPNHRKVVILNNRHDRPTRVELFAQIAEELGFDRVVTFGDYEDGVNAVLVDADPEIVNLGNATPYRNADALELLHHITCDIDDQPILLVGTVNIHTTQAETLLHFFEEEAQRSPLQWQAYQRSEPQTHLQLQAVGT
ncbi:MAG: poly-gamma-glutamate synthase PgsB [Cyanobacteria bacterium P01_F01_bin.150]